MFQVVLGPNKVLMARGCPLTRAAFVQRGLEVVEKKAWVIDGEERETHSFLCDTICKQE